MHFDVAANLYVEDVTNLASIKGRFDLILDIGCFHALPPSKRHSYILKIDQLLSETGTFLLYSFITSSPNTFGPGASEEDINFIIQHLRLVGRKDGNERGIRPSTWLTLQKISQIETLES